MSMPRTIRVAGKRVKMLVENSPNLNTNARGVHEGWKGRITLDSGCSPDEMRAVALHEILHEIDMVCGVNLTEQDVASMSSVLFGIIRDNPKLVAWLQERK